MAASLLDRLEAPGPKRLLALDGGGVRGALTISYLARMERELRTRYAKPRLVLRDYFDLIGGTSTGALIATGLAVGMEVSEIEEHYRRFAVAIFGARTRWFERLNAVFDEVALESVLHEVFGELTIGDESINTGLCIVTKRADTGSTWPLLNHPGGRYFPYNKSIRLRDAVRASSAAPFFFQPEPLQLGSDETGAFIDGGVSMANNPALLLFLVSTLSGYPFHWPAKADDLLVVSVGTGQWSKRRSATEALDTKMWKWAVEVPTMLMDDASTHNQMMLQYLGRSLRPMRIDGEVGDLRGDVPHGGEALTYVRYNAVLEAGEMAQLGRPDLAPAVQGLRRMAESKNLSSLFEIGIAAADRDVLAEHLPAHFDV